MAQKKFQKQKPVEATQPAAVATAPKRTSMWLQWSPVLLAFALYITALNHGYVLDDNLVITPNKHIAKGAAGIPDLLTTNYGNGFQSFNDGLYRPLSLVTFALEKQLIGLHPFSAHLINALLYALVIFLLLLWLRALFPADSSWPLWIALLFASHPIHTEVVANLKSRDELLAMLFFCGAAWQFSLWMESNKTKSLLFSALWYALALFSKESAVALLLVFPLMFWFKKHDFKASWLALGSVILPVLLFLMSRQQVLSNMGPVDSGVSSLLQNTLIEQGGMAERLATAATIQGLYLQKLFFPIFLSHDYSYNAIPMKSLGDLGALLWLAVNLALIALGTIGVFKKRWWGFGILFYYVSVAVVANVFVLIGAMAAERFLFAPSLGWAIAVVSGIALLKITEQRKSMVILAITAAFTLLTAMRIPDWKSNYALFTADVDRVPESARAHYNAGTEMCNEALRKGRDKEALLEAGRMHLKQAYAIWPDYQDAYNNLGTSYMNTNELEAAYQVFDAFIKRYPDYMKARFNMGVTCYSLKRYAECETHFERFLISEPGNAEALFMLIDAEGFENKFDEAIAHCNALIALEPGNSRGYQKLGMAYAITGKLDLSLAALQKAVELGPRNADNHFSLGSVLEGTGQPEQAMGAYRQALSLNPQHPQANAALQALSK